eukprot:scaffold17153_cov42-Phaeocystis_antarctica.AAC.1
MRCRCSCRMTAAEARAVAAAVAVAAVAVAAVAALAARRVGSRAGWPARAPAAVAAEAAGAAIGSTPGRHSSPRARRRRRESAPSPASRYRRRPRPGGSSFCRASSAQVPHRHAPAVRARRALQDDHAAVRAIGATGDAKRADRRGEARRRWPRRRRRWKLRQRRDVGLAGRPVWPWRRRRRPRWRRRRADLCVVDALVLVGPATPISVRAALALGVDSLPEPAPNLPPISRWIPSHPSPASTHRCIASTRSVLFGVDLSGVVIRGFENELPMTTPRRAGQWHPPKLQFGGIDGDGGSIGGAGGVNGDGGAGGVVGVEMPAHSGHAQHQPDPPSHRGSHLSSHE